MYLIYIQLGFLARNPYIRWVPSCVHAFAAAILEPQWDVYTGRRCPAKENVFGSLPNLLLPGKGSSEMNRIGNPDWVKLSVELNCAPNQNTKFPFHYRPKAIRSLSTFSWLTQACFKIYINLQHFFLLFFSKYCRIISQQFLRKYWRICILFWSWYEKSKWIYYSTHILKQQIDWYKYQRYSFFSIKQIILFFKLHILLRRKWPLARVDSIYF